MYVNLAQRRGLEVQVLDDRQGGTPPEDTLTLLVSGAGAFALLAGETGLHQVSRGRGKGREGRPKPPDRDVVRVEVLPVPVSEAGLGREDVRAEVGRARRRARPAAGPAPLRGPAAARCHDDCRGGVDRWLSGPGDRPIAAFAGCPG